MMSLLELADFDDPDESKIAEWIGDELEMMQNDCMVELALGFLVDKDPAMRASALNVIVKCSDSWPLEDMYAATGLACLSDRDPRVRRAAIHLASKTISSCEQALGDLIQCLEDRDAENRGAAFRVLIEEGHGLNQRDYFLLGEYLGHEEESVRSRAREILIQRGQEELVRGHDVTPS